MFGFLRLNQPLFYKPRNRRIGVARRTGEIGLRMALGATSGGVLRLVLRESMLLADAGIVIGALAAVAAARLVSARLFGVAAADRATFAACIALMVFLTLLAGFLPARRASSVDPVEALLKVEAYPSKAFTGPGSSKRKSASAW